VSGVTAGIACAGGLAHRAVTWALDGERRVRWQDGYSHGLTASLPGDGSVVAVCAAPLGAVLDDGTGLMHSEGRDRVSLGWTEVGNVKHGTNGEALLAAGSGCGCVWVLPADRVLRIWHPLRGVAVLAGAPVPGGDVAVLGVDVGHATVVLADASRWWWSGRAWARMPSVLAAGEQVSVRFREGCVTAKGLAGVGDVLAFPEREACEHIRAGRAEWADS
jgi:hypothetical protein